MKHIVSEHKVIVNCDAVKSYEWVTKDTTDVEIKQRHYMARLDDNEGQSLCSYETGRGKRSISFELHVSDLILNFLGNTTKVLNLHRNVTIDNNTRNKNATSVGS